MSPSEFPQIADSTGNQMIVYIGDGKGGFFSEVVNNNVDFVADDGDPVSKRIGLRRRF